MSPLSCVNFSTVIQGTPPTENSVGNGGLGIRNLFNEITVVNSAVLKKRKDA